MSKLVVFSGAGLSAESGLGTFRDNDGLWAKYDPMVVCNYENWIENFDLVHKFYNLRRIELGNVAPNLMHKFLAKLPNMFKECKEIKEDIETIFITQNVDDLLERAGVSNVIHLHGELTKIICPNCGRIYELGYTEFETHNCDKCNYKYLKPFIVFFYEKAPKYVYLYDIFSSLTYKDCVLVIGTSGNVVDISSIIYSCEKQSKIGYKILNNLEYSDSIAESMFDKILYMPATKAIDSIEYEIKNFFINIT